MSTLERLEGQVAALGRELRAVKSLLPGEAQVLQALCEEKGWALAEVMVRDGVRQQEAIAALRVRGVTVRGIGRMLGVSKRTTCRVVQDAQHWPADDAALTALCTARGWGVNQVRRSGQQRQEAIRALSESGMSNRRIARLLDMQTLSVQAAKRRG